VTHDDLAFADLATLGSSCASLAFLRRNSRSSRSLGSNATGRVITPSSRSRTSGRATRRIGRTASSPRDTIAGRCTAFPMAPKICSRRAVRRRRGRAAVSASGLRLRCDRRAQARSSGRRARCEIRDGRTRGRLRIRYGRRIVHGPGAHAVESRVLERRFFEWVGGGRLGGARTLCDRHGTAGSIVFPSTSCGVTGLRPTFGRVSRHGAMALCWSLDKIGRSPAQPMRSSSSARSQAPTPTIRTRSIDRFQGCSGDHGSASSRLRP